MSVMSKIVEAHTYMDNRTIHPVYLWGTVFALVGIGLQIYSVYAGKDFDLSHYGIGASTIMVSLGLGGKLTPDNTPPETPKEGE